MKIGLVPKWRSHPRGLTQVRERWRDAANVVAARWEIFLHAAAEVRGLASPSYLAALDAEETVATELAVLASRAAREQ